MKKLPLLVVLFVLPILAQGVDITDVMVAQRAAVTASTVVVSVTATSGDGTNCKITKLSSPKINVSLSCTNGQTKFTSGGLTDNGTAARVVPFGLGDVLCLIGLNPTASVVAMGSLGNIPANGLAYQCSTNITGGGQTTPVSGTAVWP